jgi:hypothetical protein
LSESSLFQNVEYLKVEITDLIKILTNLVSWQCNICDKTVGAEHEGQLGLWINAHEITHHQR